MGDALVLGGKSRVWMSDSAECIAAVAALQASQAPSRIS
jgi:hypothetical protein